MVGLNHEEEPYVQPRSGIADAVPYLRPGRTDARWSCGDFLVSIADHGLAGICPKTCLADCSGSAISSRRDILLGHLWRETFEEWTAGWSNLLFGRSR